MITLTREEAQQVLDALQCATPPTFSAKIVEDWQSAVEFLRARLSAPEPEPVAWFTEDHREDKSATTYSKKMAGRWKEKGWPVTPLYTAPPQREWQGLTDEEKNEITWGKTVYEILDLAEAKLKEKNNA